MAKKSLNGFTLIEMLVTVTIVAILSSVIIAYNRSGEHQIALLKDQAKVINAILRSKSLAVQTYSSAGQICGYGVHFSPNGDFIIFKDLSADCGLSDQRYSGAGEDAEIFKLDSNLKFSQLDITDILFIPPEPITILSPAKEEAWIIIGAKDGFSEVKIKINDAGQVTTQ